MASETPRPATDATVIAVAATPVSIAIQAPETTVVDHPSAPDPHSQIEVDLGIFEEGDNDADSAIASLSGDDTTSVTSSVFAYQYENGRRYHAFRAGQYIQPNDEQEQERLDMVHHWYRLTLDGALFRAPITKTPQKVLDLGTGTGIWAIEFGDEFPTAEVIGIDLSAIQPSWVPPNVRFLIEDAESDWIWPENTFDFIHARTMGGSIKSFDKLLRQAFHCLKPGGWVEFDEFESWLKSDDGTLRDDSAIMEWQGILDQASTKFGSRLNIAESLADYIRKAGFTDVTDDVYKNPMNGWPREPRLKEVGMWGALALSEGIEAISLALLSRVLAWERPAIEVLLARVRAELKDRRIHTYCSTHFVYGRKPL